MKSIILGCLVFLPAMLFAQAYPKHTGKAPNIVNVSEKIKDAYDGSTKFKGNGTIPEKVIISTWTWLYFKAEDELIVKSPITFTDVSTEIVVEGTVRFAGIKMHGADTIFVREGLCIIDNIVSEHSKPNAWNTIVVDEGAELYIAGMLMRVGDNDITISTAGAQHSKIKIVPGAKLHQGMKR